MSVPSSVDAVAHPHALPNGTRPPEPSAGRPPVLFLARDLAAGGAERAFVNIVNHLSGVLPHAVLLRRRGGLLGEVAPHCQLHALDRPALGGVVTTERLDALPGGSSALLLREVHRLVALCDATGSGAVSSFLMRSHLVALLAKRLRPRLRVMLNIHEQMTESAAFLYPRARDRAAMRLFTRHLFRTADRIVVVADELRRDLVENFGLPASRIRTVHNPVDLDRIHRLARAPVPATWEGRTDIPTVCAVGRLVPLKGYDLLLRAVALLRPRLALQLVLVGDGEARGELHALARALGVDDVVTFTGWESNPWRYLARSQLLVLSSRTEAYPSVITEALALGVPVVAAECSAGVRESVDGGRAGVLVAPESPEALASAMERVLTSPALRGELEARGRRFAARFALAEAVPRYEAVLREVLVPTP